MKIKKFPQSCVMIKTDDTQLLVDPGIIGFQEKFKDEWKTADAVLVTHNHPDHVHADTLAGLNRPVFSTSEVACKFPSSDISAVSAGQELNVKGVKITVVSALHGDPQKYKDLKENVGFVIDDGKTKFYITSDTTEIQKNCKADVLFANITATDASMKLDEATQATKDTAAKLLIVAHQDGGSVMYDKRQISEHLTAENINFTIPDIGDIIDVTKAMKRSNLKHSQNNSKTKSSPQ